MTDRRRALEALAGIAEDRGWVLARRFRARLVGWIGRPPPAAGEGLCLAPCRAVHTVGMRFPIDVLFVDRQMRILACIEALPPWRFAAQAAAFAVVELPVREAARLGLQVGGFLQDVPEAAIRGALRRHATARDGTIAVIATKTTDRTEKVDEC